ncbi:MAG: prepilin peptidase [Deltaproteobacteria bacterium]|nr:prepilin peptidase [Deltaproteobacteria bacterium]
MRVVDVPPWLLRTFAVLYGLSIGSFLNVVIARLPRDESIAHPPSHCVCGKPIAPRDNIPLLSWILLRGRARCCGAPISVRYPLVELIGGVLAWALVEAFILSAPPETRLLPAAMRVLADLAIAYALIAAAFIDMDHMYLPDEITLGGTVVAIVTVGLRPEIRTVDALLGAGIGFLGIYLPFIALYRVLRGKQGMGLGDAKLELLIGAWFGWPGVLFTLFAGSIQGTLFALITYARHGRIDEPEAVKAEREAALTAGEPLDPEEDPVALPPGEGLGGARVAFGPFLILAAIEYLLFGRWLIARFTGWGE